MATKQKTKDEIVQDLFAVVQQKKAEIAKAEKPKWETNCSFQYEDSSTRVNLQTVSDVSILLNILAYLLSKESFFKQAVEITGVEAKFKHQGFTLKDWQSDIQTRINKIQITKKKAELDEYEARLDKLVSPEKREEMELADLQKLLG